MALINCPECSNSVSDKAFACPRCGYPISQSAPPQTAAPRRPFQKPRKYHRLPNNFGTIKRLSGKRRRPFAVYPKCTGYHLTGSPVLPAAIGYFETYDESALFGRQYLNVYVIKQLSQSELQAYCSTTESGASLFRSRIPG